MLVLAFQPAGSQSEGRGGQGTVCTGESRAETPPSPGMGLKGSMKAAEELQFMGLETTSDLTLSHR